MKTTIIKFIELLRLSNIRISIAESINACEALKSIDIVSLWTFKHTLMTTLIKNQEDIDAFEKIFDLFFSEPNEETKEKELSEDDLNEIINELSNLMNDFSTEENKSDEEKLEDKLNNSSENNFNEINNQDNFSLDNFSMEDFKNVSTNNLKNKSKQDNQKNIDFNNQEQFKDLLKQGSEADIKEKSKELANKQFNETDIKNINNIYNDILIRSGAEYYKVLAKKETQFKNKDDVEQKFNFLKQNLREEIEKNLVNQFGNEIITELVDMDNLMDRNISELSIDELEKIQDIIRKLIKKFITTKSRKYKKSKKGKLDIKKTIKKSISTGTIASELQYKNIKKDKQNLVVVCDISGSVWMYVQFMLQLVIGIQNVFDKVISYIFVDVISNITEELNNSENLDVTFTQLLLKELGFGTDYGNVLRQLSKEDVFNNKTIVIIMGDAENTGKNTGEEYLSEISDKCKSIYWLNPNYEELWYENSELHIYEKYCKDVYICSTIRQLEQFVKKIIKI